MRRDGYSAPRAFLELYHDFTGGGDPDFRGSSTIGRVLAETLENEAPGPLILVTASEVYVYSPDDRRRLASINYRASRETGFFEITSVSHIGPAIAFLAAVYDAGDARWRPQLEKLVGHIDGVRAENARADDHWLDLLDEPSWRPHRARIRAMVDYACAYSSSFARDALERDDLSPARARSELLSGTSNAYPIPLDVVMIGTFALIGLQGVYAAYDAFSKLEIDWAHARVLLMNRPGMNVTAALTRKTNSWFDHLQVLSRGALPADRILIVPYAGERESLGTETLSAEDFTYYSDAIWGALRSQSKIPEKVFSDIQSIEVPDRPALPGDYGVTSAQDIEHFLMRLKYSLSDNREAQSNTIAFWIGHELAAKGFDPAAVDLPGLTTGFPDGIDGYPEGSPLSR